MLLSTQVQAMSWWATARNRLVDATRDERGEVTAWTVLMVLLVAGAATVGGIIVQKMVSEATDIPAGN